MFGKRGKKKEPRAPRAAKPGWWASMDESRRQGVRKAGVTAIVLAVVGCGVVYGLKMLELHVLAARPEAARKADAPSSVSIRLAQRPSWMPQTLASQITASLVPAKVDFQDAGLTEEVYKLAAANPWIKSGLKVSKSCSEDGKLGVVAVAAEFRKPCARVHRGGDYVYVDEDGVVMPAKQVPQWVVASAVPAATAGGAPAAAKPVYYLEGELPVGTRAQAIHYIVIEGVDKTPPAPGGKWDGDDLNNGLRLVKLVCSRAYANQVSVVDVRNYGGRISKSEPFMRIFAQVNGGKITDIRFGRFPDPQGDWEISPERKMTYLDDYVAERRGQLAGGKRYIDLRFDNRHESVD